MITIPRRRLIASAAALFCAPAIVRAENIMKVKPIPQRSIHDWQTQCLHKWTPESDMNVWPAYFGKTIVAIQTMRDYGEYKLSDPNAERHKLSRLLASGGWP